MIERYTTRYWRRIGLRVGHEVGSLIRARALDVKLGRPADGQPASYMEGWRSGFDRGLAGLPPAEEASL
jgi:hypothetical protein